MSVSPENSAATWHEFALAWPTNLEAFSPYRQKVRDFFASHLYWGDVAEDMLLGLDEAMTNIVQHAYEGLPDQVVELRLRLEDYPPQRYSVLTMEMLDQGPGGQAYDPSRQLEQARRDHEAQEHRMGYGILFLHRLMDRIHYESSDAGTNRLVMQKWFSNGPVEPEYRESLLNELHVLEVLPPVEPEMLQEVCQTYPDLEVGEQLLILGSIFGCEQEVMRAAIVQARLNLSQRAS
ncbi:MAG TPA: ATP-binding protein [Stenomitos sp.]